MKNNTKINLISIGITVIVAMLLALIMDRVIEYTKRNQNDNKNVILSELLDSEYASIDLLMAEELIDFEQAVAHLIPFVENLDSHYNVYAAMYNQDLETLTSRHGDLTFEKTVLLKPLEDERLLQAFFSQEKGVIDINFLVIYAGGHERWHDTHIYFRRFFSQDNPDNFIVVAAGIPFINDIIETNPWFYKTIYISFAIAALGFACLVATFIRQLKQNYDSQKLRRRKSDWTSSL